LTGKAVSIQAFGIFPKVAEVNQVITPELQKRVVEVHPEVCFWAIAGMRPMQHPKRKREGFEERCAHLMSALNLAMPSRNEAGRWANGATANDVMDAIAAAWTARRFADGTAGRLPAISQTDGNGIRMEMVY